jgi:hypothetical protein
MQLQSKASGEVPIVKVRSYSKILEHTEKQFCDNR